MGREGAARQAERLRGSCWAGAVLRVTWAGWELPLLLVRDCWHSEGCSWVHSPRAEQAVPLPVSLLLEPNMVGQGSRKKYSHLCFCSYK